MAAFRYDRLIDNSANVYAVVPPCILVAGSDAQADELGIVGLDSLITALCHFNLMECDAISVKHIRQVFVQHTFAAQSCFVVCCP